VGKEIVHATRKLVGLVVDNRKEKAYKIGIVGTGGVGKTTLAQKIYNDERVKGYFEKHAWICVSQQYSQVALLKELLRNIGVHQEQGESVGELKAKLAEAIKGKSFLLVLDDLWESDVWTNLLRTPLHVAAQVTILVSTRHDTVAKAIGVGHMHRVELLSEEVGWELLWKSMNIFDEKEVLNLRDTGIEIVQKCGGLPLAIRVIASVLAIKETTENEWRKTLRNDAWSMSNLPAELRGALYLSYDQLPQNMKQCFLYCALYPEDQKMNRDDLVRMWIAEGFVEMQEYQRMEDTAEEYYYELISRNLLVPDRGFVDQQCCKMHDLLRQLAHYLSKEDCFHGDPQLLEGTIVSRLRRVSFVTDKEKVVLPSVDNQELKVRTIMSFCDKSLTIEPSMFKRFMYVHVLDLTRSSIKKKFQIILEI
jgi:GTPase SAR1 family protein